MSVVSNGQKRIIKEAHKAHKVIATDICRKTGFNRALSTLLQLKRKLGLFLFSSIIAEAVLAVSYIFEIYIIYILRLSLWTKLGFCDVCFSL